MFKKGCSIFMIVTALAIVLGHNVIPHTHVQEHSEHHHSHSHSHSHDQSHSDSESEDSDFGHLLSIFPHEDGGVIFTEIPNFHFEISKQIIPSVGVFIFPFVIRQFPTIARQSSPPDKVVYFDNLYFLPSGLRAPPAFIA